MRRRRPSAVEPPPVEVVAAEEQVGGSAARLRADSQVGRGGAGGRRRRLGPTAGCRLPAVAGARGRRSISKRFKKEWPPTLSTLFRFSVGDSCRWVSSFGRPRYPFQLLGAHIYIPWLELALPARMPPKKRLHLSPAGPKLEEHVEEAAPSVSYLWHGRVIEWLACLMGLADSEEEVGDSGSSGGDNEDDSLTAPTWTKTMDRDLENEELLGDIIRDGGDIVLSFLNDTDGEEREDDGSGEEEGDHDGSSDRMEEEGDHDGSGDRMEKGALTVSKSGSSRLALPRLLLLSTGPRRGLNRRPRLPHSLAF